VVFVHGRWLLPSSWDRWAALFEEAGYIAVTAGWPDDPDDPDGLARPSAGPLADHLGELIGQLRRRPAVIGHSLGGLLTQILAGRRLAEVSVAIGPAPPDGVLPLPACAPLTYEQFRYAFASAVSEQETKELYGIYAVPGCGAPAIEPAAGYLHPCPEAAVDTRNPGRGPLLIISGEQDRTVPRAIAHAAYRRQSRNEGVTEFIEIENRGHALTIDSGWRDVADAALQFIRRFT
jgi:pimeloyl-ACP methyl ester carboxylesterase